MQTEMEMESSVDGIEDDGDQAVAPRPFDPEKINIEKKVYAMDQVLRRLEQGTLMLNPDFQRKRVWGKKQESQLIESLMLKIPIPMFYVAADEDQNFQVVDGLQRLSTIRDFVLGGDYIASREMQPEGISELKGKGFKLTDLEFLRKFEGKNFTDLPVGIRNRIMETEFTFTIIQPSNAEEVKRNVFKRINTGGEPLTPQEIRHALYVGDSTAMIKELAESDDFLVATKASVKSERMLDRELVLRFLAFIIRSPEDYPKSGNMEVFLSDTMRLLNSKQLYSGIPAKMILNLETDESESGFVRLGEKNEMRRLFETAMRRASILFGEHAFRRSFPGDTKKSPVNKALFEVWSVLLSKIDDSQFSTLVKNASQLIEEYRTFYHEEPFDRSISRDSWKASSVKTRYEKLSALIIKYSHA